MSHILKSLLQNIVFLYKALLQKRHIFLGSLLIVATPYAIIRISRLLRQSLHCAVHTCTSCCCVVATGGRKGVSDRICVVSTLFVIRCSASKSRRDDWSLAETLDALCVTRYCACIETYTHRSMHTWTHKNKDAQIERQRHMFDASCMARYSAYIDAWTHRHIHVETQTHTRIDTYIHVHIDTETQRRIDMKTQIHMNVKTQRHIDTYMRVPSFSTCDRGSIQVLFRAVLLFIFQAQIFDILTDI